MEITLEKIELVKDRTGVTYAEAKQALEENDGSVVDAIIDIEETVNAGKKERSFGDKGTALFKKLKELVKKGNVARIQVKREEDTILNQVTLTLRLRSTNGSGSNLNDTEETTKETTKTITKITTREKK